MVRDVSRNCFTKKIKWLKRVYKIGQGKIQDVKIEKIMKV
jgi:hypothetical protein